MPLRTITGLLALILAGAALNLGVWREDVFAWPVLAPLAGAVLLGVVWLCMLLLNFAGSADTQGRSMGGVGAVLGSAFFLGICVMLYAFAMAWDVSWDLTREGRRQLAPQTVKVLESMTQEVEILCFFLNIDDELVTIARDKTLRFIEQCEKHTDLFKVELLDPDIDSGRLEALNLTHLSTQGTVVLRTENRQRVITLSGGSPRLEERDFTNALINVLRNVEPKVYFLAGHQERDILDENEQTGGSMLLNLLLGEGYQADRLHISLAQPEIPPDCDILIINNPKTDLHPGELEAMGGYLDTGGRILMLLDPWRGVELGASGAEHLRPWLEKHYGVSVGGDIVVSDRRNSMWVAELTVAMAEFEGLDVGFGEYRGSYQAHHPITRSFDQAMLIQAARSVSKAKAVPKGVVVTELLRTPPDYWAESRVDTAAQTGEILWEDGELRGPVSLAVAAIAPAGSVLPGEGRPRDARMVIAGNSIFASNGGMQIPGHLNFVLNSVAWLGESEDLIAIRSTGKEDPPLILSGAEKRAIAWVSTLLTVQVVVALGLGVHLLRRKYQ